MPRPVKHSFTIDGHRTSISLEDPFWDALKEAAVESGRPIAQIVQGIDKSRVAEDDDGGLSGAVRIWILDYYRRGLGGRPSANGTQVLASSPETPTEE